MAQQIDPAAQADAGQGYTMQGAVALFDLAPAPDFGPAWRAKLLRDLHAALAAPEVAALVLACEAALPPTDPARDDLAQEPSLEHLCAALHHAQKPVIVAMGGPVAPPVLALGLAADLRLATPQARFVLPEPVLGSLPAGLVALARRIGARPVLDLALGGRVMPAQQAMDLGLIEAVVDRGALVSAAAPLATRMAVGERFPAAAPEAGLADPRAYLAAVAEARAKPRRLPPQVQAAVLDVVEAALLLPAPEAEQVAATREAELLHGAEARGLRHQALARRRAAHLARQPQGRLLLPDGRAPVIGLWHQGGVGVLALARLAAWAARGGPVLLGAAQETDLSAMLSQAGRGLGVEGLKPDVAAWGQIRAVAGFDQMAEADIVILAAPAGAATLSANLRALAGPELEIVQLGPQAAPEMAVIAVGGRTVEIAPQTALATPRLLTLAARLGQGGVVALQGAGIAARMQARLLAAAERAVLAGARPKAVDAALEGFGFTQGPFARIEAAGALAIGQLFAQAGPETGSTMGPLLTQALEPGLALYGAEFAATAAHYAVGKAPMGAAAIVERVLAELACEGAWLLQRGVAQRASDIDLVLALDCAMQPRAGGPMFWADDKGPAVLRQRLRALHAEAGPNPTPPPAPLWDGLIRSAKRFADLDAES